MIHAFVRYEIEIADCDLKRAGPAHESSAVSG